MSAQFRAYPDSRYTETTLMDNSSYAEPYRPQFHFSPEKNWMNDPNGLVWHDSTYHLFYQHNPHENTWGDIHWGHATSDDLIHWEHRPIAIGFGDGQNFAFSGCVVVDHNDTAGLGRMDTAALIALFTKNQADGSQVQCLASSVDGGETWAMSERNPVLRKTNVKDFRDPKVFWDEPRRRWCMVLAVGPAIEFYVSNDLYEWRQAGEFRPTTRSENGVWECPDLLELQNPNGFGSIWVLIASINAGGPNGGSGTQYFLGDFDGDSFTTSASQPRWLDFGPDNYAAVSYSNLPKERIQPIIIAWMSNWAYAYDVPTKPWRGAMTLARELYLFRSGAGDLLLGSRPIDALRLIQCDDIRATLPLSSIICETLPGPLFEVELTIMSSACGGAVGQLTCSANDGHGWEMLIVPERCELVLDRGRAADGLESRDDFTSPICARWEPAEEDAVSFLLVIDSSSVEIFRVGGEALVTALYLTRSDLQTLSFEWTGETPGGDTGHLRITGLKRAWPAS